MAAFAPVAVGPESGPTEPDWLRRRSRAAAVFLLLFFKSYQRVVTSLLVQRRALILRGDGSCEDSHMKRNAVGFFFYPHQLN